MVELSNSVALIALASELMDKLSLNEIEALKMAEKEFELRMKNEGEEEC